MEEKAKYDGRANIRSRPVMDDIDTYSRDHGPKAEVGSLAGAWASLQSI